MSHKEEVAHLGTVCSLSDLLIYSVLQFEASNRPWQEMPLPILCQLILLRMGS